MDDIENFEEEFPDIFSGASALIDSRLKKQESQMDSLIETKLAAREFREALTKAYPNWQQIWRTPEFQEFLNEEHELTGVQNYYFIGSHFQNLNSQGAISFFKTFFDRQTKGPTSPGHHVSSDLGEIERARKDLARLRDEKSRGQWTGREREWREKADALIKIIAGQ